MSKKHKQVGRKSGWVIAAALLATSGATAQQGAPPRQRDMVLEGGTLIDGTGRAPITDAVIVVEGSRIKAVGQKGQVQIPANATIINLAGRTILPGLIDGHVHTKEWHYPMFLHYGVTTITDLDNDTAWIFAQRRLLNSGKLNGPRMFAGGGKIFGALKTQSGSPLDQAATTSRTVDETKAYMQSIEAFGADYLKIDDTITYDQLAAVIAEGKRKNLKVLGHTQNIRKAAQMGVQFMEHMDTMGHAMMDPDGTKYAALTGKLWYPPRNGIVGLPQVTTESQADPSKFPELINELVKEGVYVNPTLVEEWIANTPRAQQYSNEIAQVIKDPGLKFVPEETRNLWARPTTPARQGYTNVAEFLKEYTQAGGKITVGTDASNGQFSIPGLSLHYEMRMLADVGVPNMKIIQGATLWNAEVIGQDKDLGSVEPGKLADFTVIEGNPLADISTTENVRMVIKAGKVLDTKYDPNWVNPISEPYTTLPWIRIISPLSASKGGPAVALEVEGTGFHPNAVVRFNDADLPTHFVSSTKLTATISSQLLKTVGSYPLYVVNRAPYGNVTLGKTFLVDFRH